MGGLVGVEIKSTRVSVGLMLWLERFGLRVGAFTDIWKVGGR